MTSLCLVALALATWEFTYILLFSPFCERLRARIGFYYEYNGRGDPIDRWKNGRLSSVLNCYSCVAVLLAPLIYVAWYLGADWLIYILATAGAVQLIGRWHISQRPRKEWWL